MADVDLMTNPMTTAGDIVQGGASGAPSRLAIGTAGQILKVNSGATALEYGDESGGSSLANVFVGPIPWWVGGSLTAGATANRAVFLKFMPLADITAATVKFRVDTAAGNLDIGIYDSTLTTKLGSTGSFACPASGPRSQALSASVALTAGTIYYAAIAVSSASVRLLTAAVVAAGAAADFTGWRFLGRQESAFPLPATPTIAGWEDTAFAPMIYFTA